MRLQEFSNYVDWLASSMRSRWPASRRWSVPALHRVGLPVGLQIAPPRGEARAARRATAWEDLWRFAAGQRRSSAGGRNKDKLALSRAAVPLSIVLPEPDGFFLIAEPGISSLLGTQRSAGRLVRSLCAPLARGLLLAFSSLILPARVGIVCFPSRPGFNGRPRPSFPGASLPPPFWNCPKKPAFSAEDTREARVTVLPTATDVCYRNAIAPHKHPTEKTAEV